MEKTNRSGLKRKKRDNAPLVERFWKSVAMIPFHTCWEWTEQIHSQGYGLISKKGRSAYAHRVSWEIHNGRIPKNLWVLHKCDNPSCVRIDHLFLGTVKDNVHDMMKKGRGKFVHRKIVDGKIVCKRGHEKELLPNETNKYVCRVCMNNWNKRNPDKYKVAKEKNNKALRKRRKKIGSKAMMSEFAYNNHLERCNSYYYDNKEAISAQRKLAYKKKKAEKAAQDWAAKSNIDKIT